MFINTPTVVGDFVGELFSSEEAYLSECTNYLGRACVANQYSSSGDFSYHDTGFFSELSGLTIVAADSASSIASSVPASAGNRL